MFIIKFISKITLVSIIFGVLCAFSVIHATLIEIDSLENEFTFVSKYKGLSQKFTKAKYTRNSDGSVWLISNEFNAQQYRYVIANEFYAFFLGDQYLPELAIIRDKKGKPHLGVKFLQDFKNLVDFFGGDTNTEIEMTFKENAGIALTQKEKEYRSSQRQVVQGIMDCFPTGCTLTDNNSNTTRTITIHNAELLLALMLLIGDMDGNQHNMGLIPTLDGYTATKIDHEGALNTFSSDFSLATLGKITMGEGFNFISSYFDYYKFDLNQLADDFELISRTYNDPIKRDAFLNRLNNAYVLMQKIVVGKSSESFLQDRSTFARIQKNTLQTLQERLVNTANYAVSMRVEAAIQSGDFQALEQLQIDINNRFHSLFIRQFDSLEKIEASFLDIAAAWSAGDSFAEHLLTRIHNLEQPLTPLIMAIYYDQSLNFIQSLAERSNDYTLAEAIQRAQSLQKEEIYNHLVQILTAHAHKDEL